MTLERETHLDWEELSLKSKRFLGNKPSFVTLLVGLVLLGNPGSYAYGAAVRGPGSCGNVGFQLKWFLHLPYEGLVPSHLSCHLRGEGTAISPGWWCGLLQETLHWNRNTCPALPATYFPTYALLVEQSCVQPRMLFPGWLSRCPGEHYTCPRPHPWELFWLKRRVQLLTHTRLFSSYVIWGP